MSTLLGNFFCHFGKFSHGRSERLSSVDFRVGCRHGSPSRNAFARLPARQDNRISVFVHRLKHLLLVGIELERNETSIYVDNFHIVLGKVDRIGHAFLNFVQMLLRQANGNVFPLQERVAHERTVGNYGFGQCIVLPLFIWQASFLISFRHAKSFLAFGHSAYLLSSLTASSAILLRTVLEEPV